MINQLREGKFFGEVGLITKMKRTATVTSTDYCTFSQIGKEAVKQTQRQFPTIYQSIKAAISKYTDFDFEFRKKMVKNIPYFRQIESP